MYEIRPKVVAELQGCKSFGFKSKNNTKSHAKLHGTSINRQNQDRLMGQIKVVLESLKNVPCEGSVTIAVDNGHSFASGLVSVYDEHSKNQAREIIAEADRISFGFSREYPMSKFTVEFSQTIELYNIVR